MVNSIVNIHKHTFAIQFCKYLIDFHRRHCGYVHIVMFGAIAIGTHLSAKFFHFLRKFEFKGKAKEDRAG